MVLFGGLSGRGFVERGRSRNAKYLVNKERGEFDVKKEPKRSKSEDLAKRVRGGGGGKKGRRVKRGKRGHGVSAKYV